MENKNVYIINKTKFYLKDYGDITWEEDEYIVNILTNGDEAFNLNKLLNIVLKPVDADKNEKSFDFTKAELKVIKKLLKEDILKKRNDFLAEWRSFLRH